jgi:integrase
MLTSITSLGGRELAAVSEVPAGDIGAVAKLTHTQTGDTLSTKDAPVTLSPLELPEALYALALTTGMRQGELFALRWEDDGSIGGSALAGGKVGFRQMAPLIGEYANLTVTAQ